MVLIHSTNIGFYVICDCSDDKYHPFSMWMEWNQILAGSLIKTSLVQRRRAALAGELCLWRLRGDRGQQRPAEGATHRQNGGLTEWVSAKETGCAVFTEVECMFIAAKL